MLNFAPPRIRSFGREHPPEERPGQVPHVWLVEVDRSPWTSDLTAVIDPTELARAASFRRDADRAAYIAAHGALRHLLGGYLNTDPGSLSFTRQTCPGCGAPHGRPALDGHALEFSLSHTNGLALLSFAGRPLGIDIEQIPDDSTLNAVGAMQHPQEREELAAAPADARPLAFARCWTRKEAYLKGTGHGLSTGLLATTLVGTGPEPVHPPGWVVMDLPIRPGIAAACAVRNTKTSAASRRVGWGIGGDDQASRGGGGELVDGPGGNGDL